MAKALKLATVLRCDFCRRTEREVEWLVASRDGLAHICGDCASQVVEAIKAEELRKREGGAE